VGPTFGIDVRDRSGGTDQRRVATCLFLKDDDNVAVPGKAMEPLDDDLSESSSTIEAPDDSEDEDNDDVSSKEGRNGFSGGGFASLGSLEDSLPIKTGLSSHFSGKSKSFANLSDACTVKDLEKSENPFNKRRRILLSSRRSSFYSTFNPKSMPLLALKEDEDEEDHHQHQQGYPFSSSSPSSSSSSSSEKKEQEEDREHPERLPKKLLDRRFLSFKSRSCFSLSDLQEHDEQQDDDDDD